MILQPHIIEKFVQDTLREDLGHGHDITSDSLIPGDKIGAFHIRARQPGIIAGLIPALTAFTLSDPDFEITVNAHDGDVVENNDIIATIEGPARAALTAERTSLNILTHLSGIASLTAVYVNEIDGTNARIADTRKTLPGLRLFQKYAVTMGGGINHRFGLDDAILIKDNHIALAGGITQALDLAKKNSSHTVKIEIEVDTLDQLDEVLGHGGANIVMLDNMPPQTLEKAVKMVGDALITEASGGITLENVRQIAETGVDIISIGALTHSAPALDIGLDMDE